jgi:lysyl-tRNA synthetase class 2
MDEVAALIQRVTQAKPMIKMTYKQAFLETCGIDPFTASIDEFKRTLAQYDLDNVLPHDEEDHDQYLFLLMSHVVEPALGKKDAPIAVYDFPSSQASLAQIKDGYAQRFEVYYQGVELANGFHELTDSKAQAERFLEDQNIRQKKGLPKAEVDPYLLQALSHGLPACSGVALGVDRLLALALQQPAIAPIMSFDFSRA